MLTKLLPALTLVKSTVPANLLRFVIEMNNAKEEYPDFNIELLDIIYKHENSEDIICIKDKKESIPLQSSSSGIQSVVPLILVLYYALNKREFSSYVIEEPECNLFPTKQVELLKTIIRMINEGDRTLTITTHSPYLLAALNNLIFAGLMVDKYGEEIEKLIDKIIAKEYQLKPGKCAVYSLGKDINGGEYCISILDETTGMIDFNFLDNVSELLGEEFSLLQRALTEFKKNDK